MSNHALEVRYLLSDARQVCGALGWMSGAKKAGANGVLIRCPVHSERNPSCQVGRRGDGTLSIKCHGCGFTGDVLTMLSVAYNLDLRSDFSELLAIGAELGGNQALADEIRNGRDRLAAQREPVPMPPPVPDSPYMTLAEIDHVWGHAIRCSSDGNASSVLASRAIDPSVVDELDLARAVPATFEMPQWGTIETEDERVIPWTTTGHRLICRTYDCDGIAKGVRGWQVDRPSGIKRLPARGRRGTGIVLANRDAVGLLEWSSSPDVIVVCEGEPDWLTWSTRVPDSVAVFGIGSGWWTSAHASRILPGKHVCIRTHCDKAGEAYARQVVDTLPTGCIAWRLQQHDSADENDKAKAGTLPENPFDSCLRI
jgi:hypothetical protein